MVGASKALTQAFDQAFLPKMTGLVQRLLPGANLAPDDIDLIFPTHSSRFTSDRVANLVGMSRATIWKANLARIGHCHCGDLFLNDQTWLAGGGDTAGPTNILSVASGMTGSCAGIVLKRS